MYVPVSVSSVIGVSLGLLPTHLAFVANSVFMYFAASLFNFATTVLYISFAVEK